MRNKLILGVLSITLSCLWPVQHVMAAGKNVVAVQFAQGAAGVVLTGVVKGYDYIDYQIQASAGQIMNVTMQPSNLANYFNILPPGSRNAAMFIAGGGHESFERMLPSDGVYAVRVYLMRAAARRNESSHFTLSINVSGKPLRPLPSSADALIAGTHFHASSKIKCEPAYTTTRECDAFVIRRGFDGTATVALRWDKAWKRHILFVKGMPVAADVPQEMSYTLDQQGVYAIVFNGDERFEIPQALVWGG